MLRASQGVTQSIRCQSLARPLARDAGRRTVRSNHLRHAADGACGGDGVARAALKRALAESDSPPRIVFSVPYFLALPALLEDTELAAIVPRPLAHYFARTHSIAIYELPYPTTLLEVRILWHERNEGQPSQEWLHEIVRRSTEHLRAGSKQSAENYSVTRRASGSPCLKSNTHYHAFSEGQEGVRAGVNCICFAPDSESSISIIARIGRPADVAVRSKRTENGPGPLRLVLPAPQLRLQNFAIVVLGKCLKENIFLWPLETGDMVETNLIKFRFVDFIAIARNHVGDNFLSPILVLAPDN